jgi:hypothetical protein
MEKPLPKKIPVRRCTGFTKARFRRVSFASCAFVVAGILIAAYSIIEPGASAVRLLLLATCCLLVACATTLLSILALLFHLGGDVKGEDQEPD